MNTSQDDVKLLRGSALRAARQTAHLSARELADRVNRRSDGPAITDHAIYSYERGKVLLAPEVAHRLAEILNLPAGELLIGDPDYGRPRFADDDVTRDRIDRTAAPPASEAYACGIIYATAEELIANAEAIRQQMNVLVQALRATYGPTVDSNLFASSFTHLLARLDFINQSTLVRRVLRDTRSRYEQLEDLAEHFKTLRDQIKNDWQQLIRRSGPQGDPADAVAYCGEVAEQLDGLAQRLAQHRDDAQRLIDRLTRDYAAAP